MRASLAWARVAEGHEALLDLFDGDGEPCDELREALAPLVSPRYVVCDGDEREHEDDPRTAILYVGEDSSTLLRRASGYRGGWKVIPLEGVDDSDLALMGVPDFAAERHGVKVRLEDTRDDKMLLVALTRGFDNMMRSWEERGLPYEALKRSSHVLRSSMLASVAGPTLMLSELCVRDVSACGLGVFRGHYDGNPTGGPLRYRKAAYVPGGNFLLSTVLAPEPGDAPDYWRRQDIAELRTHVEFELLERGKIMRSLLDFL